MPHISHVVLNGKQDPFNGANLGDYHTRAFFNWRTINSTLNYITVNVNSQWNRFSIRWKFNKRDESRNSAVVLSRWHCLFFKVSLIATKSLWVRGEGNCDCDWVRWLFIYFNGKTTKCERRRQQQHRTKETTNCKFMIKFSTRLKSWPTHEVHIVFVASLTSHKQINKTSAVWWVCARAYTQQHNLKLMHFETDHKTDVWCKRFFCSFAFVISSLIKTESHEGQHLLQFGCCFVRFCSFVEDFFESAIICGDFFLWLMIKSLRARTVKTANDETAQFFGLRMTRMPNKCHINKSTFHQRSEVKEKKKKPHWHDRIRRWLMAKKQQHNVNLCNSSGAAFWMRTIADRIDEQIHLDNGRYQLIISLTCLSAALVSKC